MNVFMHTVIYGIYNAHQYGKLKQF